MWGLAGGGGGGSIASFLSLFFFHQLSSRFPFITVGTAFWR